MSKLGLIRTPENLYSKAGLVAGTVDTDLSEQGIIDTQILCSRLKKTMWHKLYSSDMKRCLNASDIVLENCSVIDHEIVESLYAREYGDFTGLSQEQIQNQYGNTVSEHMLNSFTDSPPGGETLADIKSRIQCFYDKKLLPKLNEGKNVLCILHHDVMFVLLAHINIVNIEDYKQNYFPHNKFIEFNHDKD